MLYESFSLCEMQRVSCLIEELGFHRRCVLCKIMYEWYVEFQEQVRLYRCHYNEDAPSTCINFSCEVRRILFLYRCLVSTITIKVSRVSVVM
jgi:hypothetical protein